MTASETPPNSPSDNLEVSDYDEEEEVPFDENDVEIVEEDDVAGSNSEVEGEESEVIPERDDAQTIFREHKGSVLSCEFNPKLHNVVATGGVDENAFVWEIVNGNLLFTCTGHQDSVEVVTFSHDGNYLATADLNGVIKVWRVRDFVLIETFELEDELGWVQWHQGANVLVASSQTGMIYMYKIPSGDKKLVATSFGQDCICGKILFDGKSLACGYKDGILKIIELKQGVVMKNIKLGDMTGAVTCLDIHKHSNLIICGCESGAVILINSNNGKVVAFLQGNQNTEGSDYIEAVSFCKDPSYQVAASGSLDGTLIIWDIIRQTVRHKHKFLSCISHLKWHPMEAILFTCHFEGMATAYDAKAGLVLKEFLGHQKSCLNMSLSSNGSTLMTTSEDKTARTYSVPDFLNKN